MRDQRFVNLMTDGFRPQTDWQLAPLRNVSRIFWRRPRGVLVIMTYIRDPFCHKDEFIDIGIVI